MSITRDYFDKCQLPISNQPIKTYLRNQFEWLIWLVWLEVQISLDVVARPHRPLLLFAAHLPPPAPSLEYWPLQLLHLKQSHIINLKSQFTQQWLTTHNWANTETESAQICKSAFTSSDFAIAIQEQQIRYMYGNDTVVKGQDGQRQCEDKHKRRANITKAAHFKWREMNEFHIRWQNNVK